MPKIAILQMNSGIDPENNLAAIEQAANEAAKAGVEALFTPEMSILLDSNRKRAANWIESEAPNQMASRLSKLAGAHKIDIALGSMPVAGEGGKWANRAMYFDATGACKATYDKIHMFDVSLADGESWRESSAYEPGTQIVSIDQSPLGKLGLAICYDMRFPALFQAIGGCSAISIPAAFTVPTGRDHWHVLLRARAIEASAFVIAAAQVGKHEDGRRTYGHSLVIDPWGEVLLDMGGDQPGLGFCEINLNRIEEVRSQLPSLANRREIPN